MLLVVATSVSASETLFTDGFSSPHITTSNMQDKRFKSQPNQAFSYNSTYPKTEESLIDTAFLASVNLGKKSIFIIVKIHYSPLS